MIRYGKVLLALGMGLFMVFAAFNNAISYQGTYNPVEMAVGMQTTFKDPNLMWRAIESPFIIWTLVFGIILTEAIAGVLCLWGAARMWAVRSSAADVFNSSKGKAMAGLTLVAVFYFLAFQTIVGEWFMLWQNREASTLQEAFRNFASAMLMMMWINTEDS